MPGSKRESTYRIDRLEECVAEDIKSHITTGLDATIPMRIIGRGKDEVFFLDDELLATDIDAEVWQVLGSHRVGDNIALVLAAVGRSLDGLVQGIADLVRDEGQSGTSVGDGKVVAQVDGLAVDGGRLGRELPEALGGVNVGPGDVLTRGLDEVLVDVAEGVKRLSIIVPGAVEGRREELCFLGDVALGDHVGDGSRLWVWSAEGAGDGVDLREGQTQEAVSGTLGELGGQGLGELDGLVLYLETADGDQVCADVSRGRAAVAVLDLPGLASGLLEGR